MPLKNSLEEWVRLECIGRPCHQITIRRLAAIFSEFLSFNC